MMLTVSSFLRRTQSSQLKQWIPKFYNEVNTNFIHQAHMKFYQRNIKCLISKAVNENDHTLLKRLVFECNPYDVLRRDINLRSTKETPNFVPSESEKRIVGCICDKEMSDINWMELHQGETIQCFCGHWFKLVTYEQYFENVKLSKTMNYLYSLM